jgi:hypothetical protein
MTRWFHRRQRVQTVVKRQKYRGFLIEIVNNNYWSFRYEYVITPLTQSAKRLATKRFLKVKWRTRDGKVYDPTSVRSKEHAYDCARTCVNELCSPFWLYPWHE